MSEPQHYNVEVTVTEEPFELPAEFSNRTSPLTT
jgi:hypothetical protein